MKKFKNILFGIIVISLSSCTIVNPYVGPQALVTKNPTGSKVGIAEQRVWFGVYPMHIDVSITKAAKKGKITKIATVDSEVRYGLFSTTYKTIVTGTNDDPEPEKKSKKRSRRKKRK